MVLPFILLALAPVPNGSVKASELLHRGQSIPKTLFYAAEGPSGAMFCNASLRKRQNHLFDQRYGRRFNRLITVMAAHDGLGWEPGDIIVTPCHIMNRSMADRLLNEFEIVIQQLEHSYRIDQKSD